MPFIAEQYLIRPTSSPDQINFITWFYSFFNSKSTVNKSIKNVEPLFYQGLIAGSEFLVYAATKLYICYNFYNGRSGVNVTLSEITFYDETDSAIFNQTNSAIFWDATAIAAKYLANTGQLNNYYFSRFAVTNIGNIIFNGYRITLQ